jgi:hypothetical protein
MNMQVSNVQTLFPFVFFHWVILLLEQFTFAAIVTILEFSLPNYFKFNTLLDLLAPRSDEIEVAIFSEAIIPPLKVEGWG